MYINQQMKGSCCKCVKHARFCPHQKIDPSPPPLPSVPHSQLNTAPNDDGQQHRANQEQARLLSRRRAFQHEREQRRAAGAGRAGGTHLQRGAVDGLTRPESEETLGTVLDDVECEREAVCVCGEDELGVGASGGGPAYAAGVVGAVDGDVDDAVVLVLVLVLVLAASGAREEDELEGR